MILLKDLRIGNWVYETRIAGQKIAIMIDSIFNDEIPLVNISANGDYDAEWLIEGTSNEDIEPIPLTEDLLLKCGFEKHSEVIFNYKDEMIYLGRDNHIIDYYHFGHPIKKDIHYLHQLQNLYFVLTDQELELNQ